MTKAPAIMVLTGGSSASTSHTHNGPKAVSSKNKRLTSGGNNKREAAVIKQIRKRHNDGAVD